MKYVICEQHFSNALFSKLRLSNKFASANALNLYNPAILLLLLIGGILKYLIIQALLFFS